MPIRLSHKENALDKTEKIKRMNNSSHSNILRIKDESASSTNNSY
jgi:hypothetical protein